MMDICVGYSVTGDFFGKLMPGEIEDYGDVKSVRNINIPSLLMIICYLQICIYRHDIAFNGEE